MEKYGPKKSVFVLFSRSVIELEHRPRRNNLRIDGIKEQPKETWEGCEKKSKYYYG